MGDTRTPHYPHLFLHIYHQTSGYVSLESPYNPDVPHNSEPISIVSCQLRLSIHIHATGTQKPQTLTLEEEEQLRIYS